MKKLLLPLVAMLLAVGFPPLGATEIFVVNSASRTLSRIDSSTGAVNNSFAQLGLTPNLMDLDSDCIYVACSGDNAIQMLDRATGSHLRYIPVAASCNPYDVVKAGDFLYVTGLFTDKVYKLSLQSFSLVASLDVGTAPQGLCAAGGRLFVCNTGGYQNNYANSSVSVIDLASFSVEATLPVWANPQFAVARDGYLHVSCTGNWSDLAGKVDVIDLSTLQRVQRLDIGGNPGSLWISPGGTAYLGEGLGNALYSYGADSYEIYHGAANPLAFDASLVTGNAGEIALLKQNWASSSVVSLYSNDFSLLDTWNVGLSSTDIVMAPTLPTGANDQLQVPPLRLWPNPLPRGGALNWEGKGETDLRIYNLRGELVQAARLGQGENSFSPTSLPRGLYLYSIQGGGTSFSGKFTVID